MVPTPAPESCRREMRQLENANWLREFQKSSTQRTRKRFVGLTGIAVVCAVFPLGLWNHSEPNSNAAETHNATPDAVSVPAHTTAKVTATTDTSIKVTAPATDAKAPITQSPIKTVDAKETSAANATASIPATNAPAQLLPPTQMMGRFFTIHAVVSGKKRQANIMLPNTATSVKDALAAMGIYLAPTDRTAPGAALPAYDGMTVQVTRVKIELEKQRQFIAPDTRYKPTAVIARGAVQTVVPGKPRIIETTYKVWTVDGKVAKRQFIGRAVAQEMESKIIALGAKAHYVPSHIPYNSRYARAYALSARGGSPRDRMAAAAMPTAPPAPDTFRAVKCLELVATGYSPDPRENGGSTRTCSGLPIGYGAAAVDPRVIPLGSKLYVEGYGYAFACDTGGAIKGSRIDLAYDSYRVANSQGHRRVRVWILQP